jgi:hypothetical protein
MATLRQALIALTQRADAHGFAKDLGGLAKRFLQNRRDPAAMVDGIADAAAFHDQETSTWIRPEAIEAGQAGPFDTLDLEVWLAIATRAGVGCVPARCILTLSQDEVALAGPQLDFNQALPQRVLGKIAKTLQGVTSSAEPKNVTGRSADLDPEAVREKLAAAMDEVPEGFMVRNVRSGGSNLKAMAGSGLAGPRAPEIAFGPQIEIGPGWVRVGNRRMVDLMDQRTIEVIAQGPNGDTAFVARPWVTASRWRQGDDPHRHGTPFAGKGTWPCEWRAFIIKGEVVGVANYYGWLGDATPEDARMALEVRDLASRMATKMCEQGLTPRYMDTEFVRRHPQGAQMLADFGRDDIACTLDFIETADGLLLLEGGPAHTPFGGGHCCAFAGTNGAPTRGNPMDVRGVAFRLLPGIILADMDTWAAGKEASRESCIVSFEEAQAIAERSATEGAAK